MFWNAEKKKRRRVKLEPPGYQNRHVGRPFLVLGNGSSLNSHGKKIYRLIEKYCPVIMGANLIGEFIAPDYHAFTNRKRFALYANRVDSQKSRLLLSPYFTEKLIRGRTQIPYEFLMYVNDHAAPFAIRNGIIGCSCRTVSILLIGVALVMGASRVWVAGLDGYNGATLHFTETVAPAGKYTLDVQLMCQRFLDEIRQYLLERQRSSFSIVTPTAYENHYQPIEDIL